MVTASTDEVLLASVTDKSWKSRNETTLWDIRTAAT